MLDTSIFHPRLLKFKDPFGAVPLGTPVRFTVGRPEGSVACVINTYAEFSGIRREYQMEHCPMGYTFTYTAPRVPDLVWYSFRFTFADGHISSYSAIGFPSGQQAPAPFQLTVYDDSDETPEWFGDGISYQIFPDRFCRLEKPNPVGMIGNRWVHDDWNDTVAYAPENRVITNRDFFGGSLKGILSRLDYLESLSVTTIYLNPIFEAASNHRYDTCDYRRIDPMLGTEWDFRLLCREAKKRGIRIILDGVFNHTGNDSRYFNAHGWYDTVGAAQSRESPWYNWFKFIHWPDKYYSWWGIDTLPQVREFQPSYFDFIVENEDSVVRHWLRAGASGWRLDVADELPDAFIEAIRSAATEEKKDAVVIGEVWEDGSNKISYSERRRYLLGHEVHGLMNYPFRDSALAWLQGGDAHNFMECMETIREHYPPSAFYSAMNSLGTHDTPRILTLCGQREDLSRYDRNWRAHFRLEYSDFLRGIRRVKLASTLMYCFPGAPTIYYGDEAGMQGCEDPFNRGPFPWGQENQELLSHYRILGRLRTERVSLRRGTIEYLRAEGGLLVFQRTCGEEFTLIALNNNPGPVELHLPWQSDMAKDALTEQRFCVTDGILHLNLPSENGVVLVEI